MSKIKIQMNQHLISCALCRSFSLSKRDDLIKMLVSAQNRPTLHFECFLVFYFHIRPHLELLVIKGGGFGGATGGRFVGGENRPVDVSGLMGGVFSSGLTGVLFPLGKRKSSLPEFLGPLGGLDCPPEEDPGKFSTVLPYFQACK